MGLTEKEAVQRRKTDGENIFAEDKKTNPVKIFAGQFKDVMVMILLGATIISIFLGEITDAITIILIVFLNAVLGFIQEFRTEKTLEALKSMTSPVSKCYRDGVLKEIKASELVTDDIIELEAGDRVPADCVILKCASFSTDESILTGESLPVEKRVGLKNDTDNSLNKPNIIYCGTSAVKGTCQAKVIATGKKTQIGKISSMLENIDDSMTPLQKRLAELGKVVAIICVGVCIAVFLAGVLRGEDTFTMLMSGITIAIAAIPEGLPATVTIALALAVNRMVKQKALVNKLHSVETLGCTSVICSDKTGTITENRMTVTEIFSGDNTYNVSGMGYRTGGKICRINEDIPIKTAMEKSLAEFFKCSVLCNTATIRINSKLRNRNSGEWEVTGDPTETALLIMSAKGGTTAKSLEASHKKIKEIPFDSDIRYMAVLCKTPDGEKAYYKGASEVILPKCSHYMNEKGDIIPITSGKRKYIENKVIEMSDKALRVLAMAFIQTDKLNPDQRNLIFVGLAGMIDPPREEAKTAIRKCSSASVRTVMITGDHKNTAVAIAKKAGLLKGKQAITGEELNLMSDEQLDREIDKYSVFARVEPVHKLRIVQSFKRKGEIVTMTGDGVNDAPAIKEADVGVAMGITGTDVTKQAADVILLDDNLATLVNAVEQGRCVYSNIRKFVRYLLSCNIGEVLTMFLGIIMGMPIVLMPVQLLLVNLVTDGLPAIALGLEPPEENIMNKPPRKSTDGFFAGGLMAKIIFRGVLIGISTLASFTLAIKLGGSIEAGRTSSLITLVMSQLIHVFECKSEEKGLFRINIFSNIKLILAVLVSMTALILAVTVPQLQIIFETVSLTSEQLMGALGLSFLIPFISGFFSSKK